MSNKFNYSESHLNGWRTAENFIDESVMRENSEPDLLARLIEKLTGNDEKSKAELHGFCECIQQWMGKHQ